MRRLLLVLAIIAGLGGVAGIVYFRLRPGEDVGSQAFRIGVATWVGYAPLYVAASKGFFGGSNIQLLRIDDTAIYNSGLRRGDLEAVCNTADSFVLSAAQGVPAMFVAAFDESSGADGLVAKSEIRDLNQLRGRKVAAQTGWPGQFFLLYLLRSVGLDLGDVRFVNLDSDKAGAAFVSGDLDAAVTWEPWLSQIARMKNARVVTTSREHPGIIVDGLVVRMDVLAERERDVENVVRGYFRALDYWRENPQDALNIMSEAFGVPSKDLSTMAKGVHFLTQEESLAYLSPGGRVGNTFRLAADIWAEAGLAPVIGNVDSLFTTRVLGGQ